MSNGIPVHFLPVSDTNPKAESTYLGVLIFWSALFGILQSCNMNQALFSVKGVVVQLTGRKVFPEMKHLGN